MGGERWPSLDVELLGSSPPVTQRQASPTQPPEPEHDDGSSFCHLHREALALLRLLRGQLFWNVLLLSLLGWFMVESWALSASPGQVGMPAPLLGVASRVRLPGPL